MPRNLRGILRIWGQCLCKSPSLSSWKNSLNGLLIPVYLYDTLLDDGA